MKPPRITDEAYARIPALLEQGMTKVEIAAMYRVTLGSLKVFCSHRGISLRRGGPRPLQGRGLGCGREMLRPSTAQERLRSSATSGR
jgi:hypothetical protein